MWNTFDHVRSTLALQYKEDHWDTASGIPPEELYTALKDRYSPADTSAAQAKSELFAFLLCNAQIEIHPDEFFADKLNHGDLLTRLMRPWQQALQPQMDDAARPAQALLQGEGVFAGTDFGHLAPDWNFVLTAGIPGILARLETAARAISPEDPRQSFFRCSITVYRALQTCLLRMAKAARRHGTQKTAFVADNLEALAMHAPATLAQAMQLTLFFYRIQTFMEGSIIRSLGGLDRLYHRFYRADLDAGRFTELQLRELTADFLFKISSTGIVANLPFYICGRLEDGRDATNEYTFVLLQEYRKLDIPDPKMHVLYHSDIAPAAVRYILECIREGKNSFVFINTEKASQALEGIGISRKDAARIIVYGCYETAAEATELPATCGGRLNLAKAVELALHDGFDPVLQRQSGPHTGTSHPDFASFYRAVQQQLRYMAQSCIDTISGYEAHYEQLFPAPMLSATFESCVQKGRDIFAGGAKYNNTSIVCAGLATLADSLAAVKKMIYEEQAATLEELRGILAQNWANAPQLRQRCLASCPKFGNNDPLADDFAAEITQLLAECINGHPNGRGGVFRLGMFSVDWRFYMGSNTGATPDGRLAGEPISKNLCAAPGQDRRGVTAQLHSILRLDSTLLPDGCVADVVLHSSVAKGEDGLAALHGLLLAFMHQGGFAVHFNVLDPETLRRAQNEPEKYRNLQVRLCGWNVYFVDLSRREQDEFIQQASAV